MYEEPSDKFIFRYYFSKQSKKDHEKKKRFKLITSAKFLTKLSTFTVSEHFVTYRKVPVCFL